MMEWGYPHSWAQFFLVWQWPVPWFVAAWHARRPVLARRRELHQQPERQAMAVWYIDIVDLCCAWRSLLHSSKPWCKQSEPKRWVETILAVLSWTQEVQCRYGRRQIHRDRLSIPSWLGSLVVSTTLPSQSPRHFHYSKYRFTFLVFRQPAEDPWIQHPECSKVAVSARDLVQQCGVITASAVGASVVVLQHLAEETWITNHPSVNCMVGSRYPARLLVQPSETVCDSWAQTSQTLRCS